ncbi:MAG: hypothetical protein ACYSYT_10120 [Planctomycetota bacterium]|jgi:hypothetical protein
MDVRIEPNRYNKWITFFNTLAVLLLISLSGPGCAECSKENPARASGEQFRPQSIEERWGVEIVGVRLTSADYMLDFRYRIIDPQKASDIVKRKVKPYLIDQTSGAKFVVPTPPKVGPLRQTSIMPKAGKIYFMLFANPGRFVKKGSPVTVEIGDFVVKDLIVQ